MKRREELDDDAPEETDISGEPAKRRARTLLIRCWSEGEGESGPRLRGSVRDLARGRSSGFDGLPALFARIEAILDPP